MKNLESEIREQYPVEKSPLSQLVDEYVTDSIPEEEFEQQLMNEFEQRRQLLEDEPIEENQHPKFSLYLTLLSWLRGK